MAIAIVVFTVALFNIHTVCSAIAVGVFEALIDLTVPIVIFAVALFYMGAAFGVFIVCRLSGFSMVFFSPLSTRLAGVVLTKTSCLVGVC